MKVQRIKGARGLRLVTPWDDVAYATVQTTDATVTTCGTVVLPAGKTTRVEIVVVAYKTDGSQGASYKRAWTWRRTGDTVTAIGNQEGGVSQEDNAAWDCTLDVSGTSARVRVTGAAATTIAWSSSISAFTT